ncbi:hypothetical protein BAE44_0002197 [Dichanthelium oligosanthes]|uniref:SAM domain-containing protein n=1 Tax=Dichanthelium oligosanthes TaxID=888268 RepID=A0A1E5WHG6_9POAL|nr:hypothetical protein BAE44_0002197 [Dichanthelium oligosanthes]
MDWYAWLCRAGLHPDVALDYALLFARNELGAADVRHLDHEFLASMGVAVAKHRLEILKLARKESSSSSHGGRAVAAAITALPWRATRLLAAAVHRSARSALGRLRASAPSSLSRGQLDRRWGSSRDRAAHVLATPLDRDRAVAAHVLATPRRPLPTRHRGGRVAHSWSKLVASPSPVAVRGVKSSPLPLAMLAHVSKPVLLTNSCANRWGSNGTTAATLKALPAPAAAIAACLASTEACSCNEDGEDASDADGEDEMDGGEEMPWESMFQDLKPT